MFTMILLSHAAFQPSPASGVIIDAAGNLYGTAPIGRNIGGVVFELKHAKSGWVQTVLYTFCPRHTSCVYGLDPNGSLVFDDAGNLYGTTVAGGFYDEGTVFELSPGSNGQWTPTGLYSFMGNDSDGGQPRAGLVFDAAGNLYGTTTVGGAANQGTVFKLAAGSWNESTLHSFAGGSDGGVPSARLVFDSAGNLYGTTLDGGVAGECNGLGCGTVFELSPTQKGEWTHSVLYSFAGGKDGAFPYAGVIVSGRNLLGTAQQSDNGAGVVFKIVR